MQIVATTYEIEALTANHQIQGIFTPRGNPGVFINDAQVATFLVNEANAIPLTYGSKVGEMTNSPAIVPKSEIQILIVGDFDRREANLMPKEMRLLVFTDTYAIRGTFYTGAETPAGDVFSRVGPFFAATDVELFSIRPLATEVQGRADLAYIHKDAVRLFYPLT